MKFKKIFVSFILLFSLAPIFAQKFYWENPKRITNQNSDCRYPSSVSGLTKKSKTSAVFWEEIDKAESQIYLCMSTTSDGVNWSEGKHFAGPFGFYGEAPEIYSVTVNSRGTIAVAVLSRINEITVYMTDDGGESFSRQIFAQEENPLIGPRIFTSSNGGFIVFASLAGDESFSLLYSSSKNGTEWSEFTQFPFEAENSANPLVPYLTNISGGDLLVFQAYYFTGNRYTFQIFSSVTKDDGLTWSNPVMVTENSENFADYNNQRPMALKYGNSVYLAWERSKYGSIATSINICTLNDRGEPKTKPAIISTTGSAVHPVLFDYSNALYCLWSDSQSNNNKVYMSRQYKTYWGDPDAIIENIAASSYPVSSARGKELSFIWQQQVPNQKNRYQISMLLKDSTCYPPNYESKNFKDGKAGKDTELDVKIVAADDSSGIEGFSWIWTQDENALPEKKINSIIQESDLHLEAEKEGSWYLKIRQVDFAGNWSEPLILTYNLDTTPPKIPVIEPLDVDEYGFAKSNTISIKWKGNEEDTDVAGYTWSLQYISSIPQRLSTNSRHPLRIKADKVNELKENLLEANMDKLENYAQPPRYIKGNAEKLSENLYNYRNGLYIFTLSSIDTVGNISECASMPIILNKYNPVTYITAVNSVINSFGDIEMEIYGGGFTYDGKISAVYLDKDGKAPYDYILTERNGDYTATSENRITNITLLEIESGDYFIGLSHTDRGLYFTGKPMLKIEQYGTVKTVNKKTFLPDWIIKASRSGKKISLALIALTLLCIFAVMTIVFATKGLSSTAKETVQVHAEIKALIEGDAMPHEKKSKTQKMYKKGIGLRFKLLAYIMILMMLLMAVLISALGYVMVRREEVTRVKALQEKTNIVLDSISSGAKINLPNASSNLLALSDLVEETGSFSDAKYAVITGFSEEETNTSIDYVWATNDPFIAKKVDTETVIFGKSRFRTDSIAAIEKDCIELNDTAAAEIKNISQQITELTNEGLSLAGKDDKESVERRTEISEITTQLRRRVDNTLDKIANDGMGSFPHYNPDAIDYENSTYLFYKPVLYNRGGEEIYVHGIVFVEVSTQSLINEIQEARITIMKTSAYIIVAALVLGFISVILLSGIIVRPINKLARHVAMIRDTDDKETLAGKDLHIRSKDEIGVLGDTINEMTRSLVEAAVQAKNLTFGKEVQTRFIPLQIDEKGNTLTTGKLSAQGMDLFSYYAGADDLSGDYFDYKQLDENHYAVIKCDVSGHGVPAALIMVEVATLFLNAFSSWSMKNPKQGTNLGPVVGQINDLLESRGFKGRFAAFTLALINARTGECWFCNAGDNLVQIYDSTLQKKKSITLPETPAAGMFSTDLVDMKGGYGVQKLMLKKNDVLLLYTDGIEEAKRNFRDAKDNIIACKEDGLSEGDEHETHKVGETSEEMTPERVTEIIETVYAKGIYNLRKCHNANSNEEFSFDFSNSEGTAEDAIMALVSIEKVFRMYRPAVPAPTDRIKVDKKIDEFLRLHFREYSVYCMERSEIETDATHIYYHGVLEDPQYDDLTLIAIKKS